MVVKSKQEAQHIEDLRGVVEVLRRHKLCLNAEKCAFAVGAVKGQVLIDFVIEFSPKGGGEVICHVESRPWKVFVDGASSALGAGVGIVIVTPEGICLEHSLRLGFRASNNEAEYKALLAGLRLVLELGTREVEAYLDSRLVVNQIQGTFEARDS
ncbi:uncharacterized protein LOC112034375 [Quercus suber]|uniref:uncharacterized protein LOC112034375 n=1 Tax=Quercus suber TaxID=58331 RepID=UPI000CE2118F|nr:uncharacterized protein LOC112034375 [Quercus suber]